MKNHEKMTDRSAHEWSTIAVSTLAPGWQNTFRRTDGSAYSETAPAVLLQRQGPDGPIRCVVASISDGVLTAAPDTPGYVDSRWRRL